MLKFKKTEEEKVRARWVGVGVGWGGENSVELDENNPCVKKSLKICWIGIDSNGTLILNNCMITMLLSYYFSGVLCTWKTKSVFKKINSKILYLFHRNLN